MHVEFDATLDEAIDVQLRAATRVATYRRQRRLNVWVPGAACTLMTAGMIFRELDRPVSGIAFLVFSALALLAGAVVAWLSARAYDVYMRRYIKRWIIEQFGGRGPFPTVFETRAEGVWAKSSAFEITFPWANLVGVAEQDGDVELTFKPGLAVVRARAFRTPEERAAFVSEVRRAAGVS